MHLNIGWPRMKYVLIVFSFIELVIVIIYNIVIKKYYTTQQKAKGTFSEHDATLFDVITYFGISFSITGNLTALMQSYSFALSYALLNLIHVLVFITKAYIRPVLWAYIFVNVLLVYVAFLYARQIRRDNLDTLSDMFPFDRTPSSGSPMSIETAIKSHRAMMEHSRPPSYDEVIKNPHRFPTLSKNIETTKPTTISAPSTTTTLSMDTSTTIVMCTPTEQTSIVAP